MALSPTGTVSERSLPERAIEVLRRAGNPFRNYFARNPDDEVCARYHVPELFSTERDQLLSVVDLYRYDAAMHSEVLPVLGNKGSGKTHLLHSIKHGGGAWQLLVTPGTYQKDTDFLEYLLFQVIDTLLGGGKQKGSRPLDFIGQALTRTHLINTLQELTPAERLDLFPAPGLARWTRRLGLGTTQAHERTQWLIDTLKAERSGGQQRTLKQHLTESGLDPQRVCDLICTNVERSDVHSTAGQLRRNIRKGFVRAAILGDEAELASFLTYGFAELESQMRPGRQDLVLSLFKVLMEGFRELKIPVVVAFDQLEDLLLVRRTEDGHRIAESFFAGIVQALHQIDGICFLVFAERGLWNRFVPSLDGYIQDRLNNPVHVPGHGTIKSLRLEAPSLELVRRVVEARLRPALEELPDGDKLAPIFPFNSEQIDRIARTEPTLRDMLQQFRHLFDRLVYDRVERAADADTPSSRLPAEEGYVIKSMTVVESNQPAPQGENWQADEQPRPPTVIEQSRPRGTGVSRQLINELWLQEMQAARKQLEPEGALTGATRELQAGLGAFLQACHEHGVKVGPWRLQHVVPEWTFGEHPTYGVLTIAHWTCKDGQPWKVGVGLFLGKGAGKPKDLDIKLKAMETEPTMIDHLILLRPEDDVSLTGKSKTLWQEAQKRGRHARIEPVNLDNLAVLYGFPRWLTAFTADLAEGETVPNIADLLQERCDKLLEQVCMPVQQ
ncbi:MAG: hypothetical protein AB7K24_03340 [Gemmataceae bacterium]